MKLKHTRMQSERSYQNAAFSSGLCTQLNAVNNQMTGTKARTVPFGRKQHEVDAADSNIQCELWYTSRNALRSYDNEVVMNNDTELPQFK